MTTDALLVVGRRYKFCLDFYGPGTFDLLAVRSTTSGVPIALHLGGLYEHHDAWVPWAKVNYWQEVEEQ